MHGRNERECVCVCFVCVCAGCVSEVDKENEKETKRTENKKVLITMSNNSLWFSFFHMPPLLNPVQVPCLIDGEPMTCRGAAPNEIWMTLVEKAMAKIHGSYGALSGGSIGFGLRDLTGGDVWKVDLRPLASTLLMVA